MSKRIDVDFPEANGLPTGWVFASTDDLFSFVTSGSRGWAKYYADSGALFVRIGDLNRGTLTVDLANAQRVNLPSTVEGRRTRLQGGDILVSITADLGVIGVVPDAVDDAYINQHVALARPHEVIPKYLAWFLDAGSGGQRQFRELRRGATKAGLGLKDIRSVTVPVAPLPEQRRIVAEIETQFTRLDAAVSTLERVQANLKRARASILKAAVEGRLVPTEADLARADGRTYEPASVLLERILDERRRKHDEAQVGAKRKKKYKPPVEPDTEGLPELPTGWVWAAVDQLFDQRLGKMLDKAKNTGSFRPYLRNVNVRWFAFNLDDLKEMRVEDHELDEVSVRHGDLVVCEGGEPGRCAVWNSAADSFVIQKACHRLRPSNGINPSFYAFVLASGAASGRLAHEFTGSTIKHLTGRKLRPYAIPVPPVVEQGRIADEVGRQLSVLDAVHQTVERNLRRCTALRQSILKRAFEGKLVPQDPNDEPASELLARIQTAS